MDFLEMFVFIGTVSAVVFSWSSFLLGLKSKEGEDIADEAEKRILELMGRFKHVSSIRLEMLDRKIEEMKRLLKEANDVYSSLMVRVSEIMKLKEELPAEIEVSVENVESEEAQKAEEIEKDYEEDSGIEKRIISMYDEGFSDVEIAKRLGIGVGEVRLIISLFRKE